MKVLDLFCGAGGAAMGYHQAWPDAEIVGIDIEPQPDYPFTFTQGDALQVSMEVGREYDFIHASPPCQDYSTMSNRYGSSQKRLIGLIRHWIEATGTKGVIENVVGARSEMSDHAILLTGYHFGLGVYRPRLFDPIGWWTMSPPPARGRTVAGVYGKPDGRHLWGDLYAWSSIEQGQRLLGIDWTDDWHQLREAIPPAYTRWIGRQIGEEIR